MEIIRVDNEKIKIILSSDDMIKLGITADELDYSNITTRNVIKELLEKAGKETGINVRADRLYISIFPASDGGCEMFIKCHNRTSSEETEFYGLKHYGKTHSFSLTVLNFDELHLLCQRLANDGIKLNSSLFVNSGGNYILILKPNEKIPSYIQNRDKYTEFPAYLEEYGKCLTFNDNILPYVYEHCTEICAGNAIDIIGKI